MFEIFFLCLFHFPVNNEFNGVFKNLYRYGVVNVSASGSGYIREKKQKTGLLTNPEYCVDPESKLYWCSEVRSSPMVKPYIMLDFVKGGIQIEGYSLESSCCSSGWCSCRLNSWSLEGSEDGDKWTTLEHIEMNDMFKACSNYTSHINSDALFRKIRLTQNAPMNKCPFSINLFRIELFGTIDGLQDINLEDFKQDNEIFLIGKVFGDANGGSVISY